MKRLLCFLLLLSCICPKLFSQPWTAQPGLAIDASKRIVYTTGNGTKRIFPLMLYSFSGEHEADQYPVASGSFWNEAAYWGFNMIHSWKADTTYQRRFLNSCNAFGKICMLTHGSGSLNGTVYALPDEPIAIPESRSGVFGTPYYEYTIPGFQYYISHMPAGSLKFINFSVSPYFDRKKQGALQPLQPFADTAGVAYYDPNDTGAVSSHQSYDTFAQFGDILAFDYYPFTNQNMIERYVANPNYGWEETSVGEFTALMKQRYPSKPVWAAVQTFWYNPANVALPTSGPRVCINDTVMRQLSFDAIVNGADGLTFFGHGSFEKIILDSPHTFGYLSSYKDSVWKSTLYQTQELKKLQDAEYDSILLEQNYPGSYRRKGKVQYCFKKAAASNRFYAFVVSSEEGATEAKIDVPRGFRIVRGSMVSVGKYDMPALDTIAPATQKDHRDSQAIGLVAPNGKSFSTHLYRYGVNIISMQLVPANDDIAMFYNYSSYGKFKVHLATSKTDGSSGFVGAWANYCDPPSPQVTYSSSAVFSTVPGDFNNDGIKDIAMLERTSNGGCKIHIVATSTSGGSTTVSNWADFTNIQGNFLSAASIFKALPGDYNNDGKDDIALLYKYAEGCFKIHLVLQSTNGTSTSSGAWADFCDAPTTPLYADDVIDAVSGDFTGNGKVDVAILCKAANGYVKIHLVKSGSGLTGTFQDTWADYSTVLAGSSVFAAVPGDFDDDGRADIALLYNYSDSNYFKIHVVASRGVQTPQLLGAWADFTVASRLLSTSPVLKAVGGDFDNDGNDDVAILYGYSNGYYKIHLCRSDGSGNSVLQGNWANYADSVDSYLASVSLLHAVSGDFTNGLSVGRMAQPGGWQAGPELKAAETEPPSVAFPNPFDTYCIVPYTVARAGRIRISLYDALGRKLQTLVGENKLPGSYTTRVDGRKLKPGVYYYRIEGGGRELTGSLLKSN